MNKLIVSPAPHLLAKTDTRAIMAHVLIALAPALVMSVVIFGFRALVVSLVCVTACVLSEYIFQTGCKRPVTTGDLSACVTGLLLAFNLPVGIPLWQAVFGSVVAIVVVKQLFGGIGQNFANPAITARIVMLIAFSGSMTTWAQVDAISTATPLAVLSKHFSGAAAEGLPPLKDMLLGFHGGSLGETCAVALLIGGIYLMVRKIVAWHTPVAMLGTVFLFTWIMGANPIYHLLSGGLLLGAFFMATDYATTPSTDWGRIIFGVGCGLITVLIRLWGSYPEGVSFAILLMNILTPHIMNLTRKKPLGGEPS